MALTLVQDSTSAGGPPFELSGIIAGGFSNHTSYRDWVSMTMTRTTLTILEPTNAMSNIF